MDAPAKITSSGIHFYQGNDDDALALFELADEMVTVQRRNHGHGGRYKEPEPCQPVALREKGNELFAKA
jgi:hypothetical protein